MPRRFNFTGRRRVTRDHVHIRLVPTDQGLVFNAQLELGSYQLAPDAHVWLEAYRPATTTYRRFDLGHAGNPVLPSDRSLASFEVPDGILFRLKITASTGTPGLLVGEADAIRPLLPDEADGSRKALLPVQPCDIGSEIWRLDYGAGSPVLLINNKLVDWNELAHDPLFRGLATPAILRQILTKVLIIDREFADSDDPDDWRAEWRTFCERLPGVGPWPVSEDQAPVTDELTEDWIEDAVRSFCQHSRLFESFERRRREEGAQ